MAIVTTQQVLDYALGEQRAGRLSVAEQIYRTILAEEPRNDAAMHLLGVVAHQVGRNEDAIRLIRQAIGINGTVAGYHGNLGMALVLVGKPDEAIEALRHAIRLQPDYAGAYSNLAHVLGDTGRWAESLAACRAALEFDSMSLVAHSNLISSMLYVGEFDDAAILRECRLWNERHAMPLKANWKPHANERRADRRLRVGYVSSDFRDHVVGRNIWPLIENHDRRAFEIYFFANQHQEDGLSAKLKSLGEWTNIAGLSDEEAAERIRAAGIDILVDLSLHMHGNRLLIFARRPAPVQVTFAGYPGTTGVGAIDYRLTDPYLDPPGTERFAGAETAYRLPASFWCYDPQTEEPAVSPLPAERNGYLTFGCFNNFCKVNREVLALWAGVLGAVAGSRMTMLCKPGSHRDQALASLGQLGIAAERVVFCDPRPRPEYLRLYQDVDIGLDTFPYNGHTTSLDSYWMGVPVVTLVGETIAGRAGLSQLTNLGMPGLIAHGREEYTRLAVGLATDVAGLGALRAGLRRRMKESALMDAGGFTRGIEKAYREMWARAVANDGGKNFPA